MENRDKDRYIYIYIYSIVYNEVHIVYVICNIKTFNTFIYMQIYILFLFVSKAIH